MYGQNIAWYALLISHPSRFGKKSTKRPENSTLAAEPRLDIVTYQDKTFERVFGVVKWNQVDSLIARKGPKSPPVTLITLTTAAEQEDLEALKDSKHSSREDH